MIQFDIDKLNHSLDEVRAWTRSGLCLIPSAGYISEKNPKRESQNAATIWMSA